MRGPLKSLGTVHSISHSPSHQQVNPAELVFQCAPALCKAWESPVKLFDCNGQLTDWWFGFVVWSRLKTQGSPSGHHKEKHVESVLTFLVDLKSRIPQLVVWIWI